MLVSQLATRLRGWQTPSSASLPLPYCPPFLSLYRLRLCPRLRPSWRPRVTGEAVPGEVGATRPTRRSPLISVPVSTPSSFSCARVPRRTTRSASPGPPSSSVRLQSPFSPSPLLPPPLGYVASTRSSASRPLIVASLLSLPDRSPPIALLSDSFSPVGLSGCLRRLGLSCLRNNSRSQWQW